MSDSLSLRKLTGLIARSALRLNVRRRAVIDGAMRITAMITARGEAERFATLRNRNQHATGALPANIVRRLEQPTESWILNVDAHWV